MTPGTQASPRPLLNGELWPLTGQLAFIEAAASDVVEVLAVWRLELGREPAVSAVTGSLRDLLGGLQPLGFGYRELVLPTTSRWTSYWSNDFNGPDPAPLGYLAERMACRALFLMWSTAPGQEANQFELYADHPTSFSTSNGPFRSGLMTTGTGNSTRAATSSRSRTSLLTGRADLWTA